VPCRAACPGRTGRRQPANGIRHLGYAEVAQASYHRPVGLHLEQDVRRLDITVDDRLGVRIFQADADLDTNPKHRVWMQSARAFDKLLQASRPQTRHHQVRRPGGVVDPVVEHWDHVVRRETRGCRNLAEKRWLSSGRSGGKHLDRHHGAVRTDRFVHLAVGTGSDAPRQLVAAASVTPAAMPSTMRVPFGLIYTHAGGQGTDGGDGRASANKPVRYRACPA